MSPSQAAAKNATAVRIVSQRDCRLRIGFLMIVCLSRARMVYRRAGRKSPRPCDAHGVAATVSHERQWLIITWENVKSSVWIASEAFAFCPSGCDPGVMPLISTGPKLTRASCTSAMVGLSPASYSVLEPSSGRSRRHFRSCHRRNRPESANRGWRPKDCSRSVQLIATSRHRVGLDSPDPGTRQWF